MIRVSGLAFDIRSGLDVLTDDGTEVNDTSLDMSAFLNDNARKQDTILNDCPLLYYNGLAQYGMIDYTVDTATIGQCGILNASVLTDEV